MKKAIILLGMLVFAVSGCTSYHNSVPNDMTQVKMEANITTSYKILGPTEGKGEAVKVLFFWVDPPTESADNLDAASYGAPANIFASIMDSLLGGAKKRAEKKAAYNALENYPGADRIIDAKWKTEVLDYGLLYKKAVSTCTGTAVQFSHK